MNLNRHVGSSSIAEQRHRGRVSRYRVLPRDALRADLIVHVLPNDDVGPVASGDVPEFVHVRPGDDRAGEVRVREDRPREVTLKREGGREGGGRVGRFETKRDAEEARARVDERPHHARARAPVRCSRSRGPRP